MKDHRRSFRRADPGEGDRVLAPALIHRSKENWRDAHRSNHCEGIDLAISGSAQENYEDTLCAGDVRFRPAFRRPERSLQDRIAQTRLVTL
jgi:hypothetical protein